MQQGIQLHQSGQLPEAEIIYRRILNASPNHADANHLLGVIAYQVGNYDVAEKLISQAIQADPEQPLYYLNLGNVQQDIDHPRDAITSYEKAVALNPDFPEAHNNMGNAWNSAGQPERAISCFQKAINYRPEYAEAHNNLGNIFKDLEQFDEAIAHLRKALALNPGYVDAYHNIARALFSDGQEEEAIENCEKAIGLRPDFIDAHLNLGMIRHKQRRFYDALASAKKAVELAPENQKAYAGLANALRDLGMPDKALEAYQRAISLNPDDDEAWGNLQQTIKVSLFNKGLRGRGENLHALGLSPEALTRCHFAILENYLDSFRPHEAEASFDAAISALPGRMSIHVSGGSQNELFDQMVGLLHFGRSGTGLIHSLIDNHPEISTLPSIYLSGYFNIGVWDELAAGDINALPERFADKFAVLFDANSPKPIPSTQRDGISLVGAKEGMANVGNNRNEVLTLDREKFCAKARDLISTFDSVDAGSFLQIIHAAYEHALDRMPDKHCIFYHIHNPNGFAKFNFLRHASKTRLMMMIREPVQSCESWLKRAFESDEYASMTSRIITMLYDIDQVAFRRQDSIGVRLEDLKSRPQATMQAMCKWMGIEESPSLYEMTAQGKKWWGDPSSPDYSEKDEMSPFDDKCVVRSSGTIFGEQDRFMLQTLFHPFSVHFGYTEHNPEEFKRDLIEARELLGGLFDFERAYLERTEGDSRQLQLRNTYQLLRAALTDRFDVLDGMGAYPHMLTPLALDDGGTSP